jgi:transaldolase
LLDFDYFRRVGAETGTRLWVNNPTLEEAQAAVVHGAIGCTTNPAYGSNLIRRDPERTLAIVAECEAEGGDDRAIAERIQRHLIARLVPVFMPIYEASRGQLGFVSIQGAPDADADVGRIVGEAREARDLGANIIVKVPATETGFAALQVLLPEGWPLIVTECFSLDQVVYACDLHRRLFDGGPGPAPFFVAPITGIFEDHLKAVVEAEGIDIAPEVVGTAGVAWGRRAYDVVKQRGFAVSFITGGARSTAHFTAFVGADMHITINWSTALEILANPPDIPHGINHPVDPVVVAELEMKLRDFAIALTEGSLRLGQFEQFGPVQHFRNAFVSGWEQLLATVQQQRRLPVTARQ